MRKGFTMVEMIFVMVILGILGSVAIPKMSSSIELANRNSALDTLSSVRSSIDMERQKRILRGDSTPINSLTKDSDLVFDFFNEDSSKKQRYVLKYPIKSCSDEGCWEKISDNSNNEESKETYFYHYGSEKEEHCIFKLENNGLFGKCPELKSYR